MHKIENIIINMNEFMSNIIKKKYCLDNENTYEDVINKRFIPYLKNNNIEAEDILLNRRFIPGGSILRGFQNQAKVSMSNCYVLMPEEDSIEGIFELCKKMARTYSYSGGVGYDISILRPRNCEVNNSAKYSTGAVSFLPLFDTVTKTIGQNGRRGAALAAIQDWHPDVLDFIKAKAYPEQVFNRDSITNELPTISYTNISVKISDEFMKAVETDGDWKLYFPDTTSPYYKFWNGDIKEWGDKGRSIKVYKTIRARDMLRLIAECSHKCGDPGILFWDNHIKYSTVEFNKDTKIENVNPCVTGNTMLFTRYGLKQIEELVDQEVEIWNGFEWVKVIPHITGYNREIVEIVFNNDIKLLCTEHHKFVLKDSITRVGAIHLKPGDELLEWKDVNNEAIRGIKVKRINYAGIAEKVYCFTEPKRHLGMFNGIVTGQCGEMPLHRNANCNLGALVLYKYVNNQYTDKAEFNFELFKNDCKIAVEIMDCLLDESINKHPLLEQREQAAYERRVGIGITGLADCLAMMGLRYDSSEKTLNFIEEIMQTKCKTEWEQSLALSLQKGCAPALKDPIKRDNFLKQLKIQKYLDFLEDSFEYKVFEYGLRNIALSTVQPSGTLSIIANNCTSGIEPLFSIKYKRKTRIEGNEEVDIVHPVLLEYLYNSNLSEDLKLSAKELCEKYNYIEANNVSYEDKLKIQAVIQKYVDTAISSTVNLPNETNVEDIYELYMKAYKNELKGITVFRDGCKTGVLESSEKSSDKSSEKSSEKVSISGNPKSLVLTKEEYLNIIKFCGQNHYNAETTLAFIDSYLKVGTVFNNYEEFDKWIKSLNTNESLYSYCDVNDDSYDNIDKQVYQSEKNLGLYEIELLDEEDAVRHRIKWKNGIKVYINVTIDRDENKPLEVFVSLPYEAGLTDNGEFSSVLYLERKADWDAIGRLISVLLRYNIPLTEIIEQLQKSSYSMFTLSALMKRVLSKYISRNEDEESNDDWDVTIKDGLSEEEVEEKELKNNNERKINSEIIEKPTMVLNRKNGYNICPECKSKSLIFEAGCWKCLTCFYSKCE